MDHHSHFVSAVVVRRAGYQIELVAEMLALGVVAEAEEPLY